MQMIQYYYSELFSLKCNPLAAARSNRLDDALPNNYDLELGDLHVYAKQTLFETIPLMLCFVVVVSRWHYFQIMKLVMTYLAT